MLRYNKNLHSSSSAVLLNNFTNKLMKICLCVYYVLQVHIEQGPVLEQVGFPLGVVKGIAGQTRLKVYK